VFRGEAEANLATLKRSCGSPLEATTGADRSSFTRRIARRAVLATRGSTPQHMLVPYKQEVARSSRAPPIVAGPLSKRDVRDRSSDPTCPKRCCGSVVEARRGPPAGRTPCGASITIGFMAWNRSREDTTELPIDALAILVLQDYVDGNGWNWQSWMRESEQPGRRRIRRSVSPCPRLGAGL